jgi:hypothetical protein
VAWLAAAGAAAEALEELHSAHENREKDGFGYRRAQISLGVMLGLTLACIVAVSLWRGQALADVARATGGLIHGEAMTWALGLLTATTFVCAVLGRASFRQGHAQRAAQRRHAQARLALASAEAALRPAEAAEEKEVAELVRLEQQRAHSVESVRAWAAERKARIRHRAGAVELDHRRRHARDGATLPSFKRRAGGFRMQPGDGRGG